MTIKALAPWFGSNRMLAPVVAAKLRECEWVGVPFAGGMSEVLQLTARTMLVNDLHRHVINLALVVSDNRHRAELVKRLNWILFHPDTLKAAQNWCSSTEPIGRPDVESAVAYFVCCWMGRSGKAGIDDEFNGRPSTRWNASGGDSAVRFRNAVGSLKQAAKVLRRCTFETMDAFDFLARCEDKKRHGVYADPPFPKAGRRYQYNCGQTDAQERQWHTRLRDAVAKFRETKVVMRFYDHPLIRELYDGWTWDHMDGRTQANTTTPEVLLTNCKESLLF